MPSGPIQVCVDGKSRDIASAGVVFSSVSSPWAGFLIESMRIRREHLREFWFPRDVIMVHTGIGNVRYRTGTRASHHVQGPGNILIGPAQNEYASLDFDGDPHRIFVELGGPIRDRLLGRGVGLRDLRLGHYDGIQDPIITSFLNAMKAEIEAGCPSGSSFGESTSLALLVYLAGRYAEFEADFTAPRQRTFPTRASSGH